MKRIARLLVLTLGTLSFVEGHASAKALSLVDLAQRALQKQDPRLALE